MHVCVCLCPCCCVCCVCGYVCALCVAALVIPVQGMQRVHSCCGNSCSMIIMMGTLAHSHTRARIHRSERNKKEKLHVSGVAVCVLAFSPQTGFLLPPQRVKRTREEASEGRRERETEGERQAHEAGSESRSGSSAAEEKERVKERQRVAHQRRRTLKGCEDEKMMETRNGICIP